MKETTRVYELNQSKRRISIYLSGRAIISFFDGKAEFVRTDLSSLRFYDRLIESGEVDVREIDVDSDSLYFSIKQGLRLNEHIKASREHRKDFSGNANPLLR